jgi:hypothetical protein
MLSPRKSTSFTVARAMRATIANVYMDLAPFGCGRSGPSTTSDSGAMLGSHDKWLSLVLLM